MSIATRIAQQASNPNNSSPDMVEDRLQADGSNQDRPAYDFSRTRTANGNPDALLHSSASINMTDERVMAHVQKVDNAAFGEVDDETKEQVRELMGKLHPDNNEHLLYPAYFAQSGGRSGFQFLVQTTSGMMPLQFADGLFVTTSVALVETIRNEIRTNPQVAMHIQEVTAQQYSSQLQAAQQGRALLARGGGMMSTQGVAQDQAEIIAAQKRQIEELEAKLNKQAENSPETKAAVGNSNQPFNFGSAKVAPSSPEEEAPSVPDNSDNSE